MFNFLAEAVGACVIVFGSQMIQSRRELLDGESLKLFFSYEGGWKEWDGAVPTRVWQSAL